ncbi:histidine kinase [Skermanella mucosa]|uniref:histidine kinase n=1 Tax=Skermanella mucosa TaxID=1789672 RepID=UPI00192ACDDB|nr:histidine kinase [Skermanella mucosa]UEM23826.1 histidine kinase [Skermanella mucosa]
MSFKLRFVLLFSAVLALAVLVAGIAVVVNARTAVETEVDAGMELATTLVIRTLAGAPDPRSAADAISSALAMLPLRHVRIAIAADGAATALPALVTTRVPDWFYRLVGPDHRQEEIRMRLSNGAPARVLVVAAPEDEIAEVWADLTNLALILAMVSAAAIILSWIAMERALRPLAQLSGALERLGRHEYQVHLEPIRVRELRRIGETINTLALELRQAEDRNRELGRKLIEVQEAERRQIAGEIHDELGPCLFGIRVEIRSLAQVARTLPDAAGGAVTERCETVLGLADTVQRMSRRLLDRLRPMALEHLPLSAVLADTVKRWRVNEPGIDWHLRLPGDVAHTIDRLDDTASVTLYRVVQESLMNVARHAGATRVEVELRSVREPGAGDAVGFSVRDDGRGIASDDRAGIGIHAMSDQVRALGGSIAILSQPGGGVTVQGMIPFVPGSPRTQEEKEDGRNARRKA